MKTLHYIPLFSFVVIVSTACNLPNKKPATVVQAKDSIHNWLHQIKQESDSLTPYYMQKVRSLAALKEWDSLWYTYSYQLNKWCNRNKKYDLSIRTSHSILDYASEKKDSTHMAKAHFRLGEGYFNVEVYDSAYYHFNGARVLYGKFKDSLEIGVSLLNMAVVHNNVGDYHDGEATAREALTYLQTPKGKKYRIRVYNNLGISSNRLKQYKEALYWFDRVLKNTSQPRHKIVFLNNMGVVARNMKNYPLAQDYFHRAMSYKIIDSLPQIKAMVLDNIGHTMMLQSQPKAFGFLWEAYEIRKELDHKFGLIVSLLHLGKWYEKRDKAKARSYYLEAMEMSENFGDIENHIAALEALSKRREEPAFDRRLIRLKDSLSSFRNELRYRFAKIKYRVDEQEAENNWLRQAYTEQVLLREKEKNRVQLLRLLLISALLFVLLLLLFVRLRHYNLKQQISLEKLKVRADEKERMASYLHDDVANDLLIGLQQSEKLLQQKENQHWASITDQFEVVYEKIRQIAQTQSQMLVENIPFLKRIKDLSTQICFENELKIKLTGLEAIDWESLPREYRGSMYSVLREALLNIKKHAQASKAGIDLKKQGWYWSLSIWDNGNGIKGKEIKGLGLLHMDQRVREMGGKFSIKKTSKKGTIITINLRTYVFKKRN